MERKDLLEANAEIFKVQGKALDQGHYCRIAKAVALDCAIGVGASEWFRFILVGLFRLVQSG